MFYLLYMSQASYPMEEVELFDILQASHRNNARLGVTGLLLYKDQTFIQLLEGTESAVLPLYKKISQDTRHTHVRTLLTGDAPERAFPDWSMGLKNLHKLSTQEMVGLSRFLEEPFDPRKFIETPHRALRFLFNLKEASL